ncbi:FxSxx-COOH system tetratricopeptide repeat protein [Streptomyces ziwulingensis]|uniref:FxSxx-COOH system tetratricopeptide repeat protein n=1 Tax=Streptomyces ziwulingensis TaxID=1045501 RepID=UPI0031E5C4EE
MRAERPAAPADRRTVTLSFAGFDRAWAAWIGDLLERRGQRVAYLRWEPSADTPLSALLQDLGPGPVLLVLSGRYFDQGAHTSQEWAQALRGLAAVERSRFTAVSVTASAFPSAARALTPIELAGLSAPEAERRLLDRLDLPPDPVGQNPAGAEHRPRYPATAPEVWGAVPRRNTRFTGREEKLAEVHQVLQTAGTVTLYGMSGMGKTQLATEYAHRFGPEYDVVWWVNADNRVTCRRQLAELAPRLGLLTGQEYGERLRAVRDSLRRGEPYPRWLLVLDGADDPDQVGDLVPTGPGHVLITSRNPEWSEHGSGLLEVGVYSRAESVAFVRRRAPRLTGAEADRLAQALDDLPLLLDQTAGWLTDSDLSVEEYIGLLGSGIDSAVVRVSADFPLAFETAWSMLLHKLRETVPESIDLLRLCTFFAPGLIPVDLLQDMPREGLPPSVANLLTDPALWSRAVGQLRRFSVVRVERYEAAPEREFLYLHRLVHQFVHKDMPDDDRHEFVDVVRRALAAADPGRPSTPADWPVYAEIVPHLTYARGLDSTDAKVQGLVLNCLRYLYLSGEYGAGVELGERAATAWRGLLGESHPLIWELIYHYANLLRASGDYHRTMQIERAAVRRLQRERGERDPDLLRTLGGLAADLRGLGQYEEALELSERVLANSRAVFGEEDTRSLNALNNVAVSLRLLGRYREALDLDRKTMEARRRLLRAHHPWTLNSELAYAVDLRLLGRYSEAEAIQERNLWAGHEALGADSPQSLRAGHGLAMCRYLAGDLEGAARHFSRALERGERVLGEEDPLTLIFAVGQSCFVREHGDAELAGELGEAVIARYEATLTAGHPYTVGARANHALVLRRAGERDAALALAEATLSDMTTALGPAHPWTLGCALNASAARADAGDAERALVLSGDTVTGAALALGPGHPFSVAAQVALAADLRALGRQTEADDVERRALAVLMADFGGHHPLTVSARARARPYWDFEPQIT